MVCVDEDVILTRITAYTIATPPLINSAALGPGDYAWSGCFGLLRPTTHNWRAAGRAALTLRDVFARCSGQIRMGATT